jgi:hypothetical protein
MSSTQRSGRIVVAGVAAFVPIAAFVVVRLLWTSAPLKLPSHFEGNGTADGFSCSSQVFVGSLIPAIVVALIALAIAVFGDDFDPLKRALALGVTNLLAAVASLAWLVFSLSEVDALRGGTANIGEPFLIFLCAIGWGLVALLISFPFRRRQVDSSAPTRRKGDAVNGRS